MSQPHKIVSASAMPVQEIQSYPPGANSPMTAGVKMQQQQTSGQMALIGGSRRRHRRKYMLGGTVKIVVPPVPSGTVNSSTVNGQYTDLTKLATAGANNAVYDNHLATKADVNNIAMQQNKTYTGGSKHRGRLCSKHRGRLCLNHRGRLCLNHRGRLCSSYKKNLNRRRTADRRRTANRRRVKGSKSRKYKR